MIPNNRGISLMTKYIDERYNTFIHFIYAPPKMTQAEEFWKKTEKALISKQQ